MHTASEYWIIFVHMMHIIYNFVKVFEQMDSILLVDKPQNFFSIWSDSGVHKCCYSFRCKSSEYLLYAL